MPSEHCGLCGKHALLQNSHILPEFVYRPIYDANHKGHRFHPLAPEKTWKFQGGIKEPLLCRDCERFLNDEYERPFKEYWFDRNPIAVLDSSDRAILSGIDYSTFKLFHLSVLLRAGISSRPEFGELRLGSRHETRLKGMILEREPGTSADYPVVCVAIRRPDDGKVWWDIVGSPNPGRMDGVRFHQFTFGGCSWFYFASSHLVPDIALVCLKENGTMPVIKEEASALRRFRAALPSRGRKGAP